MRHGSGQRGADTSAADTARAERVAVGSTELRVRLTDGRSISAPLEWFPRLANATRGERADWRLIGAGVGIHWPRIDEDISVAGLLAGGPAPTRKRRATKRKR
ncbi:MAG: DUF2442 domain-containing protein [Planctomycetes bacterium]|nr:DUF2442 domain-containing protein [Planctomycetota bacterium]